MNTDKNLYNHIISSPGAHILFIFTLVFCINFSDSYAATTDTPTDWSNIDFFEYTNSDFEAPSYPAQGSASSVVPDRSNISPGLETSAFWGYYDGGTIWDGVPDSISMNDDYLAFSVRIKGDPRTDNMGFKSTHWNFLIDIDGDGFNEFWVDLDGSTKRGPNAADELTILYNSENTKKCSGATCFQVNEFTACTDTFDEAGPSSTCLTSHTRVFEADDGTGEFYIHAQVPITAFDDNNGNQIIFPSSLYTCGDNPCNLILF